MAICLKGNGIPSAADERFLRSPYSRHACEGRHPVHVNDRIPASFPATEQTREYGAVNFNCPPRVPNIHLLARDFVI